MRIQNGIRIAMMVAMVGSPPQRSALHTGGAYQGEQELHRTRGAERLVREIAVIETGQGEHAHGVEGHEVLAKDALDDVLSEDLLGDLNARLLRGFREAADEQVPAKFGEEGTRCLGDATEGAGRGGKFGD